MNLLKLMKEEVSSLHLSNELEIIRYLYIRTGQIFDYDPRFDIVDEYEKENIAKKRIDIENVEEFDIVCETWNYLFVDLLQAFGIEAKVLKSGITKFHHSLVEITTKNYGVLYADLMIGLCDLGAIKLGKEIINMHFSDNFKDKSFEEIDKKIKYNQGITFEEVLGLIKKELLDENLTYDELLQSAFKVVGDIINFPRKYTMRYCSGNNWIFNILLELTGEKFASTQFYNLENNEFIEVFPLDLSNKTLYYVFKKDSDGTFKFLQIEESEIKEYLNDYDSQNSYNLKCS